MADKKIDQSASKVPLNLVPLASLKGPARVAEHGKVKYSLGNWHQADDEHIANRYIGGLLRHVVDAQRPDGYFDMHSIAKLDDESGLPEIDHAIMGLLMLRGLAIKGGYLPADPGQSKLVRQQADVRRRDTFSVGSRVRIVRCDQDPGHVGRVGLVVETRPGAFIVDCGARLGDSVCQAVAVVQDGTP